MWFAPQAIRKGIGGIVLLVTALPVPKHVAHTHHFVRCRCYAV